MFNFNVAYIIANIPALLIGFAFHEFAHAWVADFLGDPTPRSQGRLTLNPLVHLDIFGTLMALLYRFGWAKPVMTNPSYYRGNPLRGRMYVALAGPLMNLVLAFFGVIVLIFVSIYMHGSQWGSVLSEICDAIVKMNLGLGIFNLLPIPPLDGYAVLGGLLPARYARFLWSLEPYGMIILVILLFINTFNVLLYQALIGIYNFYLMIAVLILSPFIH